MLIKHFVAAHCGELFVFRDVSDLYLCILLIAFARLSDLPTIYSVLRSVACRHVFPPCSSLLLELNEVKSNLWYFRLALDEKQPFLVINEENF